MFIRTYTPTGLIPKNSCDSEYSDPLRDAIDGPIVNTQAGTTSVIASLTSGVDEQGSSNFLDTSNAVTLSSSALIGTQFQCDLEYYLPRFDSLFIDSTGARSPKGTPDAPAC